MTFIQISEKYDAKGFILMAKSGTPVLCLPGNVYGIQKEHLKLLKKNKIPSKLLFDSNRVRVIVQDEITFISFNRYSE